MNTTKTSVDSSGMDYEIDESSILTYCSDQRVS
jgi:hypothetical protein